MSLTQFKHCARVAIGPESGPTYMVFSLGSDQSANKVSTCLRKPGNALHRLQSMRGWLLRLNQRGCMKSTVMQAKRRLSGKSA